MTTTIHQIANVKSQLSFVPLIEKWKQKLEDGRTGAFFFYKDILQRVSKHPELLEPIANPEILKKHPALLEVIMSTIFPVTYSDQHQLYAVSVPFKYDFIYSSSFFKMAFLDEEGNMRVVPETKVGHEISNDKLTGAYKLILKKFYNYDVEGSVTTIHPYVDPFTGLTRHLELCIDPQFIDIKALGPLPEINFGPQQCSVKNILKMEGLQEKLPLSMFEFEGIAIIHIEDVTEREVIAEIKNELLNLHSFADPNVFNRLQRHMQNLLGLPDVKVGVTPFFRVNNHYVFSEQYYNHSILLQTDKTAHGQHCLQTAVSKMFEGIDHLVVPALDPAAVEKYPFLQCAVEAGGKSLIIKPLRSGTEIIGVMVLMSEKEGQLNYSHLSKIEQAIPLFQLGLEKSAEQLDTEIDRVIKQQFTAVQSSVEWKFTEAALEYITKKNSGEDARIGNIVFDNVYPLYGAVDIRNSSIERNQAIQQDLLEQLNAARAVVQKAQQHINFPLLQEISYRIDKYVYTVSNILFSGDEVTIHNFLKEEIVQLFRHLRKVAPMVSPDIDAYFSSLDAHIEMMFNHRKEFEKSITTINSELAKFMDKEQALAQQVYPHYFERFATDGVDFNIYIGQAITPDQPFDNFYLKNMKMWQLTTLARAAQMTHKLEKKLALPLHTTQLILAHSNPISISFRTAERKFDVDGAYNIRYEIIKKRIDKVRIKDSNERLTQPGKLAIVFSQPKEANEYAEYIEFLQNQGLLTGELEHFDLEELQGVSGLKALRVGINMEEDDNLTSSLKVGEKGVLHK